MHFAFFAVLVALAAGGYCAGSWRANLVAGVSPSHSLHSHPLYHGIYGVLLCLPGPFLLYLSWLLTRETPVTLLSLACLLGGIGLWRTFRDIDPLFPAQRQVENALRQLFLVAAFASVLLTAAIFFSVIFEAIQFFQHVPALDFLFGLHWSPQGSKGAFGAVPVFTGTLLITLVALAVAVPLGLFAAIYMAEYAAPKLRRIAKPALELLAGIPTVVYGYFAVITVAPFLRGLVQSAGLDVASESALTAGLVMGIMIIPFVSSLSDDIINAVPQSLRDASYGLGATQSETIRKVVLPAALPGIMGAVLLAFSRAIGETMIVVMAAGLAANLTANPLQAVTTVTAQIVMLLTGDQEFDSPKTLAAFALGLVLFLVTLALNVLALWIVKRYREQYE